ncbi:uncharacterized protein F5147DRAFT_764485 [Suillus discolor]|uniref:Uncharacterized protein n=1 Tax=Suillus discolor TaxID=1912936 RepID=A0A9P7ETJ9_9AGAM|nr:uncharacterized protein F5147DRAFT_764485 [Suillus discolor]KAG2090011.1 hypothetical protein F5147DRAFT_764485 [Suillus discolor]
MASRADAATLEDNHKREKIEPLTFPHNLGRDSPFSSCPLCSTGVDLLALMTSALSLLALRKQTECNDATTDPAGTEERTEWKLATPAEQGQRSTPEPPLGPDLDKSDHRYSEKDMITTDRGDAEEVQGGEKSSTREPRRMWPPNALKEGRMDPGPVHCTVHAASDAQEGQQLYLSAIERKPVVWHIRSTMSKKRTMWRQTGKTNAGGENNKDTIKIALGCFQVARHISCWNVRNEAGRQGAVKMREKKNRMRE